VFEDENVLETIFTNESVVSFRRDFHENDDVFGKHRKLIQYLLRWDPQQRGYSTVLPEFSMQKGDIFYDFLSPPASSAILSTTTKYYSFQETRRSGLDAFTKEDVEALQKQIGQHNDSKNEKKKN
jgi:hypothetical protein